MIGLRRQERPDRIGSEGSTLLERVAQGFDALARREPDRFVVIDAEQSFELVMDQVWAAVRVEI